MSLLLKGFKTDSSLEPTKSDSRPLAIDNLARNLLKELNQYDENPVISPSCLYLSLAMLSHVTADESREELMHILGTEQEMHQTLDCIASMAESTSRCKDFHYSVGTSIWADESLKLHDSYSFEEAMIPIELYQTQLGSKDGAKLMSEWLSQNTGGLFSQYSDTPSNSKLIALGATHLKDSWSEGFDDDTPRAFRYTNGNTEKLPFMVGWDDYNLYESNGSITLSKQLSSGCNMILSLPPQDTNISEYVSSGDAWQNISKFLNEHYTDRWLECKVFMPKFDLSSDDLNLNGILSHLGLSHIFTSCSAFLPLSSDPLVVDSIQQSTRLSVDEKGLEGASYVRIMMCTGMPPQNPPKPREIVFDRPFVVAVTSPHKCPLFLGIMTHPNK